ncbi:MAG: hypothetical protein LBR89_01410 [Holosporales bacterium]|jgi:hypothetical protein|nr:hypothetical protein [Holosporales bacterium]
MGKYSKRFVGIALCFSACLFNINAASGSGDSHSDPSPDSIVERPIYRDCGYQTNPIDFSRVTCDGSAAADGSKGGDVFDLLKQYDHALADTVVDAVMCNSNSSDAYSAAFKLGKSLNWVHCCKNVKVVMADSNAAKAGRKEFSLWDIMRGADGNKSIDATLAITDISVGNLFGGNHAVLRSSPFMQLVVWLQVRQILMSCITESKLYSHGHLEAPNLVVDCIRATQSNISRLFAPEDEQSLVELSDESLVKCIFAEVSRAVDPRPCIQNAVLFVDAGRLQSAARLGAMAVYATKSGREANEQFSLERYSQYYSNILSGISSCAKENSESAFYQSCGDSLLCDKSWIFNVVDRRRLDTLGHICNFYRSPDVNEMRCAIYNVGVLSSQMWDYSRDFALTDEAKHLLTGVLEYMTPPLASGTSWEKLINDGFQGNRYVNSIPESPMSRVCEQREILKRILDEKVDIHDIVNDSLPILDQLIYDGFNDIPFVVILRTLSSLFSGRPLSEFDLCALTRVAAVRPFAEFLLWCMFNNNVQPQDMSKLRVDGLPLGQNVRCPEPCFQKNWIKKQDAVIECCKSLGSGQCVSITDNESVKELFLDCIGDDVFGQRLRSFTELGETEVAVSGKTGYCPDPKKVPRENAPACRRSADEMSKPIDEGIAQCPEKIAQLFASLKL